MTKAGKKEIKTVAVFCSSRFLNDPIYREHAEELGQLLGKNGYNVVYGGGDSGLMGVVSNAARAAGSKVLGIMVEAFKKGASPEGIEEQIVRNLDIRVGRMLRKADAVIVLPGGIGSFHEEWSAAAVNDMKIAARSEEFLTPIAILNTKGYYNHQKAQMLHAIAEGGIHPGRERMMRSFDTPQELIAKLKVWSAEGVLRGCDLAPAVPEPAKHGLPPTPMP